MKHESTSAGDDAARGSSWPTVTLALVCLSLCLLVFPLTLAKPGWPLALRANEPATYLAALSLAYDYDLECEVADLGRIYAEYPTGHSRQVRLLEGASEPTFATSWVYPALAAPFARASGANGMVALNMALAVSVVWLGYYRLREVADEALAALFAAGFVLLSPIFVYVFRLQGEVLHFALVAVALSLVFSGRASSAGPWSRFASSRFGPFFAAGALALVVHDRPHAVFLVLPAALHLRARGAATRFLMVVVIGVIAAVAVGGLLSGRVLAHLTLESEVVDFRAPERALFPDSAADGSSSGLPEWLPPSPDPTHYGRSLVSFLVGRHTGLVPHLPFAVAAIILYLLSRGRADGSWLLVAAAAAAAALLLWLPHDWFGGDDLFGSRFYLCIYPVFLFLPFRRLPGAVLPVAYGAAGLFLSVKLFTPLGARIAYHDDLIHARGSAMRWFPLESELLGRLPDWRPLEHGLVTIHGREDQAVPVEETMYVYGGLEAELWLVSSEPMADVVFRLRNHAPENRIRLSLGGEPAELRFSGDAVPGGETRELTVVAPHWQRTRLRDGGSSYAAKLEVETSAGAKPRWRDPSGLEYFVGMGLTFLASSDELARDLYPLAWGDPWAPVVVTVGDEFEVRTELSNRSDHQWPAAGAIRVELSHRWRDRDGRWQGDARRMPLPASVAAGTELSVGQPVRAPVIPGCYELVLDVERHNVTAFSAKSGVSTYAVDVEVRPFSDHSP